MSRCLACGSAGPEGVACETCLIPRPSFAPVPPISRPCPRCAVPLAAVALGHGATVFGCLSCRWTFWTPQAWSLAFDAPAVIAHVEAQVPLPTIRVEDGLLPLMGCPVCGNEMERVRFAATSRLLVDTCRWLHGIWLDAGDVRKVVDYAEHKRRVGADEAVREADDAWARTEAEREADRQRAALELRRVAVSATPAISRGPNLMTLAVVFFFALFSILIGIKVLGPSWKAKRGAKAPAATEASETNDAPREPEPASGH